MAVIIDGTTGITTPGETNTGNLSVAGSTTLTTPLPVASGGTGASSLSGITVGTATNATTATSATTSTNLAGGSNGTIPYQSASGTTQMLAVGTSGQVLKSNGVAAPSWITPSAGAVSLISATTASAAASVIFTGLTTTYAYYYVEYDSLVAASAGPTFEMYVSDDNGSSYKGGSQYKWTIFYVSLVGTSRVSANTGNYFAIAADANGMGTAADNAYGSGIVYIYSPAANSCTFTWQTMNRNSTTLDTQFGAGGLVTGGLAAINAIKFQSTGAIAISGNFRLYGVAKT